MEKLIPISTQESLRDLKDTLRLLGIVIDEEKDDFDSLSWKVNKLEKKALDPLQKSSKKAEKSLQNFSKKTEEVGEKVEEATEDLKR
jgi:KaiC/GvpD/RAD55 family RecA-like ATPase